MPINKIPDPSSTATGTVSSVGLALPAGVFSVSGSPVTGSGTLTGAFTTQSANTVFAGPASGGAATPTFRALVTADMPAGTGTVTSVAATVPAYMSVAGSPITTSGTLAITTNAQSGNKVLASPANGSSGTPDFRVLVAADVPSGFIKGTAAVTAGIPYQNGTADTVTTNAALTWLPDSTGLTVLTRAAAGSPAIAEGLHVVAPTGGTANYAATFTGGNVGIRSTTPIFDLTFGGNTARTCGQERHSTADTAGNTLTVNAGGATSGATNKAGGTLILAPGVSTGSGTGSVTIQAYPGTAGATSDNTATTILTVSPTAVTAVKTITATMGSLTGSSTPAFSSTATWNNAATTFVHQLVNVTDTASASGSLLADWQVGGVSKFSVAKTGAMTVSHAVASTFNAANFLDTTDNANTFVYIGKALSFARSGTFGFQDSTSIGSGYSYISVYGDNPDLIVKSGGLVAFLGTTSSFPALKRSATELQHRLADDSAYGPMSASTVKTAIIYTVATLPTGSEGMRASVSDALAPTFFGVLVGGGTIHAPAYYDGTNWIAG